uniref:Uncharacterized protein n=1 Tax=Setaria digitata TaxID=48799 RepID=A0A915PGX3_9BILA
MPAMLQQGISSNTEEGSESCSPEAADVHRSEKPFRREESLYFHVLEDYLKNVVPVNNKNSRQEEARVEWRQSTAMELNEVEIILRENKVIAAVPTSSEIFRMPVVDYLPTLSGAAVIPQANSYKFINTSRSTSSGAMIDQLVQ